jgi:energy-coupling factor transporter ATP-binding protein EcfA2
MSYMEPGYHKPGDPPFSFPPKNVDSRIDYNLIEIEGKNGSGKTTLLNCLALALGYLDQEKELATKPALKKKLQDLDENKTLECYFRISCEKPENIDLRIERIKGQKPKYWLNSKPVDTETLARKFDIVFLTEDDPLKVVSSSLGKIHRHFNVLEKGLVDLQDRLFKNLQEISEYCTFEKKEQQLTKEIEGLGQKIEENKEKCKRSNETFAKVKLRDSVIEKLQLLKNEKEITEEYENLRKKLQQLKGKTDAVLIRKLEKERFNLRASKENLNDIDSRIVRICTSLSNYGIKIEGQKLLDFDYSELNTLNKKLGRQQREAAIKIQIVEEMITLLKRYNDDDVVPLVNMQVHEALRELNAIRIKNASERISTLLRTLNAVILERKENLAAVERIQGRILELSKKSEEIGQLGDIQKAFSEAEKKHLDLQVALETPREELFDQWRKLKNLKEESVTLQSQIEDLDASISADEKIKSRLKENLQLLRENATKPPKHKEAENRIKILYETISQIRENVFQWGQILQDPAAAREQFTDIGERPGFGIRDFQKFVTAIGEYLGNQFEPVAYDYRFHNIKFFDIEKSTFMTSEDRQIPIDKLSQGQSKITTLTGSFKKMDPSKKKIVLIDEIADLDPENLQNVKNTLNQKLAEGSLLLAVLVRPLHASSAKVIDVKGWA